MKYDSNWKKNKLLPYGLEDGAKLKKYCNDRKEVILPTIHKSFCHKDEKFFNDKSFHTFKVLEVNEMIYKVQNAGNII